MAVTIKKKSSGVVIEPPKKQVGDKYHYCRRQSWWPIFQAKATNSTNIGNLKSYVKGLIQVPGHKDVTDELHDFLYILNTQALIPDSELLSIHT
ncbi:MAG: hypothetical protein OEX12_15040 [Gammaproteobacteria bacterium]|nr:hypothetical protein [Gammaproteobacteria bacterium]